MASEDEQLVLALEASRREQQRQVARTDEEERALIAAAIAASLGDDARAAGVAAQTQPRRPGAGSGGTPHYPPIQPPAIQQQQQQQPWLPWQPQQPQQQQQQPSQGQAGAGASDAGSKRWTSPLRLLDSALARVGHEAPCPGCGRWLGIGPAVKAMGQQWHPQCFKCAGCQQPLSPHDASSTFAVHEGRPYHLPCHKQLFHPRCYVCGDYIPERGDGRIEWRENPFWKQPHCPSHSVDGTPQCCSCNKLKPVSEEWVGLSDGRQLCLACLDTLVVDTADAQPLYAEVLGFFTAMGMPHPYKVPLLLVEGHVLEEYGAREGRPRGQAPGGAAGPVFHVRGLCVAHVYTTIPSVVRAHAGRPAAVSAVHTALAPLLAGAGLAPQQHCTVSVLLVLFGLPRLLAGSIIAHELMHAYLRMRHVTGLPLQVEEGLCQLLALLWLESQSHAAPASAPQQSRLLSYFGFQIRTDESEVYGEGFRIALEKFQQRGLKALVEHVIAHGAWPAWVA